MPRPATRKPVDAHPLIPIVKEFLVRTVRSSGNEDRDLSARQMSVFLIVATEESIEHTVRGLSARLEISKPAITRAIDRLEDFKMVKRNIDETDRRSIFVTRTAEGTNFLRELSKLMKLAESKPTTYAMTD